MVPQEMQSPQKKTKVTSALRSIHGEQVSRLQTKHQHESDLLEDIRNFSKQRAAIEKTYGEALLRLSTSYLQRKIAAISEVDSEDGKERKTVYAVWRTALDETEKVAKARMAAAEVFQHQIWESAKSLRAVKAQQMKKCIDNLQKIQEEVQRSVRDLEKTKKTYFDQENVAHDARDKAHDAEEKLKRKKGGFFQTLSSVQKNSAKFSSKREACDTKSTGARNEYLLALAATNAHQRRYHEVDLPELMRAMDSDAYEKVAEFLQILSQTELFTCAATHSSYSNVKEMAELITRNYNLQCYVTEWTVLRDKIQYEFEPCHGDLVDRISADHNAAVSLSKEARKWATRIAKETKLSREANTQLRALLAAQSAGIKKVPLTGDGTGSDQCPQQDIEHKIEELRQDIRKANTNRVKAEARLEALRAGGVNVDEWVKSADSDSLGALDIPGEPLSRAGSQLSIASGMDDRSSGDMGNDSYYDSDNGDDKVMKKTRDVDSIKEPEPEVEEESVQPDAIGSETTSVGFTPLKCLALYAYTAQNPDELSIEEQQLLEIVGEGDGDGWVKARNEHGDEGYVPQSYVEVEGGESIPSSIHPAPASFSSVDYYVPGEDNAEFGSAEESNISPSVVTSVDVDVQDTTPKIEDSIPNDVDTKSGDDGIEQPSLPEEQNRYFRAVYDYEATCPDELTIAEGQIIRLLRKNVHDVDDGWWEGETDGHVGLFPSLVVEEVGADQQGNDLFSPEDLKSPPGSAPPPLFSPPAMPQLLLPPSQVIITQPTPETESPNNQGELEAMATYNYDRPDFEMEITDEQQAQYQTQFVDTKCDEDAVIAPPEYDNAMSDDASFDKTEVAAESTEAALDDSSPTVYSCRSEVTVVITAGSPCPSYDEDDVQTDYQEHPT